MDKKEAMKWLRYCAESHCVDCAYENQPIEWCSAKMKECVDAVEEALSADLISRADVLALAEKGYIISNSNYKKVCDLINELPSAEAPYMFSEAYVKQLRFDRDYLQEVVNKQWIPCSERVPKEKARVLTYDSMGDIVFGQYDKGRWYWEAEACADYWAKNDGVIAWQPLPTPYKGGEDE